MWKKKLDEVLALLEKNKTEKRKLKKTVHDLRRERDFVRKYLDEYLYEPAIRSHLNEIGMLLENESQNINTLLTENDSEQFYKEIMDFYNVMESEADSFIKGEIEEERFLKVEIKNGEKQADILTEKTVNILEKYSKL